MQPHGSPRRSPLNEAIRTVLNPGHSSRDPGAVGKITTEAVITRAVTIALFTKRDALVGYEPKRQPAIPGGLLVLLLTLRLNKPAVTITLHVDSATSTENKAGVYYRADDPDKLRRAGSLSLAESIVGQMKALLEPRAEVVEAPYSRARQDGSTYLFTPGILKRTARSAIVLVELGNIRHAATEEVMVTVPWQGRAATAIDLGLRNWLGNPD